MKGSEAAISLMSAGECDFDPMKTVLDTFRVDWEFSGTVFAEADGVDLTDARIKLVTVD